MTAKFERHPRHAVGGKLHQRLADRDRPGEAELTHDARSDQLAADRVGDTMDELEHPRREPSVVQRMGQRAGAAGRFLGRLGDDRTACGERRRDFLGEQIKREIPRGERRHHPDRLVQHDRSLPGRTNQRPSIIAPNLLGVPVKHRRRPGHFLAALEERLALLLGHQPGDCLAPLAHERRRLAQDRTAFVDRGRAPLGVGPLGGGQRLVEIGGAGERHLADAFASGGIDDRECITAFARAPAAVDEEFQVCVIAHRREIGFVSRRLKPLVTNAP